MVTLLHRGHAGADVDDDACALMAKDGGKQPLRIGARPRELIRVADAGCLDLDQDFAGAWAFELDGRDFERFAGRVSHCGADIHGSFLCRASG